MSKKYFVVPAVAIGVAGLFYADEIRAACKAAGFSQPACDAIDPEEVARVSMEAISSGSPSEPGFIMTDPNTHEQREVIVQPARWWYIDSGRKSDSENEDTG